MIDEEVKNYKEIYQRIKKKILVFSVFGLLVGVSLKVTNAIQLP